LGNGWRDLVFALVLAFEPFRLAAGFDAGLRDAERDWAFPVFFARDGVFGLRLLAPARAFVREWDLRAGREGLWAMGILGGLVSNALDMGAIRENRKY
jgi:hypothetical protein